MQKQSDASSWRSYAPVWQIVALGLSVTIITFLLVWLSSYQRTEDEWRANIEVYGQTISANLKHYEDVVTDLKGFVVHTGGSDSQREFDKFAHNLISQHAGVQGLLWAPRIPGAARLGYEVGIRDATRPDLQITERGENGDWRRAAPRDEYFPITLLTQINGNMSIVGYDLGSEPDRRRALEQARDTGQPAATLGIQLVGTKSDGPGILFIVPVYREDAPKSTVLERRAALTGFAVGAIQSATMIEETIRAARIHGFDIYFFDGSISTGYQFLYAHRSRSRGAGEQFPAWQEAIDNERRIVDQDTIRFGDRHWMMIANPAANAYDLAPPILAWSVFVVGLLATGLAGRYTLTATCRARLKGSQDALTGLVNRSTFVRELRLVTEPDLKNFAVLYLDLDHFKDVNDTMGRAAGDRLLRAVAERLRAIVRENDSVARFGGDEFAILQTGISDSADAVALAEKVQKALGEPFSIDGSEILTQASIGIALSSPDLADAETILARADLAVYRAKSEGRGTYKFFSEALDREVRDRVNLGIELREALASGQFFLMYQPQVDVDTGRILGLEALARWRHPTRGLIAPGKFIPAAESNGLIVPLGHWVLHEACRQMKNWLDVGIAPPMIGVNVSGLQFKVPLELENDVAAILAETALPPGLLELEFTETLLIGLTLEHDDALQRLRRIGLRIAIDDFGTGYSSLEYLGRIPVNRIKISQNFMTNLTPTTKTAKIVKAAIGMAHELGLDVVIEGVETAEQLAMVKSFNGRKVQGYYFSKPLPADETTALLRVGKIIPVRPTAIEPAAA